VARDMATHFLVTIVDAKEYFEYTPGILRCYVKPKHFDALSFNLHPVIEDRMGCKFIWGEVTQLNDNQTAHIKPMFQEKEEIIDFDYCIIAAGCNFGPFKPKGESLWFPTVHNIGREVSEWKHLDERFIEGRRRHMFEEYAMLKQLQSEKARVMITGAGFIGVEWVTELEHFFHGLDLSIVDMLPRPLGPLPDGAAKYCTRYMDKKGINGIYGTKIADGKVIKVVFNPETKKLDETEIGWDAVGFKDGARPDKDYVCVGVKASNYFMPPKTLSTGGPMGGQWIVMDKTLAVCEVDRDNSDKKARDNFILDSNGKVKRWCADSAGYARVYAVGDCNFGCVMGKGAPGDWPIPPIPKISYPGEEQAVVAARNVEKTDHLIFHNKDEDCFGTKIEISEMHWPWGAGMFATSLGPHDACFVVAANWTKSSGFTVLYGSLSAVQKEFIEHSKVDECSMGFLGRAIWHFVHHTPVHLWGGGPRWGY